jgi:uncharacterized membrane protein HdeD (DUF308 family)
MKGLTKDKSTLINAIILLVSGITFIASPVSTLGITLRIVGALILLWEGFDIYTKTRLFGNDKLVMLLFIFNDAFVIICALILLISPVGAIKALSFIIGLYLLITSGMTVFRKLSGESKLRFGETAILVVSVIVGFWLVLSPFNIMRLTSICIGIALVLKAVSEFWTYLGETEKRDSEDYVTDDFVDTTDSLEDEINKLR